MRKAEDKKLGVDLLTRLEMGWEMEGMEEQWKGVGIWVDAMEAHANVEGDGR